MISAPHQIHQVTRVECKTASYQKTRVIYFIVLLLFEHFQMIQAIQVLRFHLLELEKVTFSHHLCPTRPFKPARAALAEMHFCSSLVISVKINHGAIFSSAFNHDASCYKWNGRRRAPCPSVSAPFNDILCRQKLHARLKHACQLCRF